MKYPKIPLAQTVVEICKQQHIGHIIISPGSRNAPLTIGFTNDSYFKCYSIVDERCAAFFALGIAQQTQQPTTLVCTSGSALLNYYPAIAEAYFSNIPLIVISADRPEYLINIGDGQTINQKNVYANHIFYEANLKEDFSNREKEQDDEPYIIKSLENKLERFSGIQKNIQKQNEIEINEAIVCSKQKRGPVHINVPFNEPLYEQVDSLSVYLEPYIISDEQRNELGDLSYYSDLWNNSKRKMVLVGVNAPNDIEQKYLDILANDDSVIVFTETTSNLHHDDFFPSIDKIIAPLNDKEFLKLQPDILITFGGMIVSKKIKMCLRTYQPKHHWHIGSHRANDTFYSLSKHFKNTVNQIFENILINNKTLESDYKRYWNDIKFVRNNKHDDYIKSIPFSDFLVFNSVLKSIPNDRNLQLGNSSAVRYAQLFDLNTTLQVFCNRGTSGIDGSTSTAIGAASVSKKPTVLITGDLSFFYDSNALWNNYIPNNFRIILINNGGGGIFRILPGHKNTDNFDEFFETKHNLNAEQLCKMYSLEYLKASSLDGLSKGLSNFYNNSESPKVLEIFTPSTVNDEVLLNYFKYIK